MGQDTDKTEGDRQESGLSLTARRMADALAYLIRVAKQAEMAKVATKLGSVRADLLTLSGEEIKNAKSKQIHVTPPK